MKNLYHAGPTSLDIFPHQFSSVDFLLSNPHKNVLIYQKMGYGKTILACIFALFASGRGSSVYIIVPNKLIAEIWEQELNKSLTLVMIKTLRELINIDTMSGMHNKISEHLVQGRVSDWLKRRFENSIFIIDEAHKVLDNDYGKSIRSLQSHGLNIRIILITATPIVNTPQTVVDLAELISNQEIHSSEFYTHDTRVYEFDIVRNIKEVIRRYFMHSVLYFFPSETEGIVIPREEGKRLFPLRLHKFVLCKLSSFQAKKYRQAMNDQNNPMFSRVPVNLLLFCYSDAKTPQEISEDLSAVAENKKHVKKIIDSSLENASISYNVSHKCLLGSLFTGPFLEKISCKLYHLLNIFIDSDGKHLCFFQNVDYGFSFIKSVMLSNGIGEYPDTTGTRCAVCMKLHEKSTSHDFVPASFVILTGSRTLSSGQQDKLVEVVNSDANIHGLLIKFVFISDAFSVGYSFRNFLHMHMLTPRDTETETDQTVARIVRKNIHVNNIKYVSVYLYMAVFGNEVSNQMDLLSYLQKYEKELTVDTKRYIYSELKYKSVQKLSEEFKEFGDLEQLKANDSELIWLYKYTLVKRILREKLCLPARDLMNATNALNSQHPIALEDVSSFLGLVIQTHLGWAIISEVISGVVGIIPLRYLNTNPQTIYSRLPEHIELNTKKPIAFISLFFYKESGAMKLKIGNRTGISIQSIKKERLGELIHILDKTIDISTLSKKEDFIEIIVNLLYKLNKTDKRYTYVVNLV